MSEWERERERQREGGRGVGERVTKWVCGGRVEAGDAGVKVGCYSERGACMTGVCMLGDTLAHLYSTCFDVHTHMYT